MILEYTGQWWGAPRPYYESEEAAKIKAAKQRRKDDYMKSRSSLGRQRERVNFHYFANGK